MVVDKGGDYDLSFYLSSSSLLLVIIEVVVLRDCKQSLYFDTQVGFMS